jgi:hypothetical protein
MKITDYKLCKIVAKGEEVPNYYDTFRLFKDEFGRGRRKGIGKHIKKIIKRCINIAKGLGRSEEYINKLQKLLTYY